jgi:GntR family transcriptional regulator/MocR family aminotransferase
VTVQLHITLGDRARLADTLYQQLVDAIRSGQLRQGDPLPPTRQLAAQLRVSRSTSLPPTTVSPGVDTSPPVSDRAPSSAGSLRPSPSRSPPARRKLYG